MTFLSISAIVFAMNEVATPRNETTGEPRLVEGLEPAQLELEKVLLAKETIDGIEGIKLSEEQTATLEEDIAAKSDWVKYLKTRDFVDDNEQRRDPKGQFKSRIVEDSAQKHQEEAIGEEYKDRSYAELISLVIDAQKHGDKTMVGDINEAIIDKIAEHAKRNGFTEEQTDRLYDRVVVLQEKQQSAVSQELATAEGSTEDLTPENEVEVEEEVESVVRTGEEPTTQNATETEGSIVEIVAGEDSIENGNEDEKVKVKDWLKLRTGAKGAAWYLKHPGAAARMALTKLHQLPGKAIEGLSNMYKTEDGETNKKKLARHAIIGTAVAGSIITLTLIARKIGAEGSLENATEVMMGAEGSLVENTTEAAERLSGPMDGASAASEVAETLPLNSVSEALGEIDVENFRRPWGVASEVAELTGETTRGVLGRGIEEYNKINGTDFRLVKFGDVEMIADSTGHIVNKAEETAIKEAIVSAAG